MLDKTFVLASTQAQLDDRPLTLSGDAVLAAACGSADHDGRRGKIASIDMMRVRGG